MTALPELVPISDLRVKQAEILAGLVNGPVILTQYSRGAAVLLSLDHYNRLIQEIEDLQDALEAAESRADSDSIGFDDYLTRRGERVPA
jgi:prevent-host-death family protein